MPGARFRRARHRLPLLLLVAVALLASACGGATSSTAALASGGAPTEGPWRGITLTKPVLMPDVTLTDTSGASYDLRTKTAGTPTLLFFGYTHCPDICPVTMATLARAFDVTGLEPGVDVNVVFITADPSRDTPSVLAGFLDTFNSRFVGLTGSIDTIKQAISDLDMATPVQEDTLPGGGYTVGHPAQVIAFNADGVSQMVYPFGVREAGWAHDLPKIADGASWPAPSGS